MPRGDIFDQFFDGLKRAAMIFAEDFVQEKLAPPQQPRARRVSGKAPKAKKVKAEKPAKRERQEPTLYQVLGVDAKAEPEVIEAAWKAGMRKYHPDTNRTKSAEARSKAINAAHDILRDPEKRKAYDLRLKLEAM